MWNCDITTDEGRALRITSIISSCECVHVFVCFMNDNVFPERDSVLWRTCVLQISIVLTFPPADSLSHWSNYELLTLFTVIGLEQASHGIYLHNNTDKTMALQNKNTQILGYKVIHVHCNTNLSGHTLWTKGIVFFYNRISKNLNIF